MPPRVLASGPLGLWASGPKPCGGNYFVALKFYLGVQCELR